MVMKTTTKNPRRKQLAAWIGLMLVCQLGSAQTEVGLVDQENEEANSLESITVVGEKVERSLQDTQSSVAVTTALDIKERGYYTIQDVYTDTAGVVPDAGGLGFSVRGIPFEGLGGNRSSSDVVTVYIDGVPQTNSSVNFSPVQLWDVEQVEIYRGAQSTVQGRNSLAGAVIVNTQRPTYDYTGKFRFTGGRFGTFGGSAALGGGIVDDRVAFRVAVDHLSSDGYIDNETLGIDGNETEFNTINAKLLFEPSEYTDILLIGNYASADHGELANDTTQGSPFDNNVFQNIDAFRDNKVSSVALHIDHEFNDRWSLASISTFSDTKDDSLLDLDQAETRSLAGELRDDTISVDRNTDIYTQELRLAFNNNDDLRAHLGFYYYGNNEDSRVLISQTAADRVDPNLEFIYADGFRFNLLTNSDVEIDNYAVFGEVEWDIDDHWTLVAGARQDFEDNESVASTVASNVTAFNGASPQVDALLAGQLAAQNLPRNETDASFDAFLPKLGIVYNFNNDFSLGFTAQRAYRAGGRVINLAAGTQVEYDPEYTNNFELSFRGQWPEYGITLNSNIYYIDWEDQQVTVLSDPDNAFSGQIENAGESHLAGIEVLLDYQINSEWNFYTSTSFNDTEYDDFVSSTSNLSNRDFQDAPEFITSFGFNYYNPIGLGASIRARYQSDSTAVYEVDGLGTVINERENDSFFTLDLTMTYEWREWLLSAQINNLFDENYITNNQTARFVDVGAPRSYLVSLQYEFY
jgi:outer membrane receptor protein involved in Fe transport